MDKTKRIFIAGHSGMIGSALTDLLTKTGYENLILKSSSELDLRNQSDVEDFFAEYKPEFVFLIAAKVGGIQANINYPAEFIYDNIMIQTNIIHNAYKHKTEKLIFIGSSCIYPKNAPQPMKEEYLLDGKPEPTNEAFAIAKISGIKLCQAYNKQYGTNFITVIPANTYGPNDNFDLNKSHVLSALIRKFYEAKEKSATQVNLFGTGNPKREFLYVKDLAKALLFIANLKTNKNDIINIGTGEDISIRNLAELIKNTIGFYGDIVFDTSMPDGVSRKLLDISMPLNLGWKAETSLEMGIQNTIDWFMKNVPDIKE